MILSYFGLFFAFVLSDHWQNCNSLRTIIAIFKFVCNFQETCKTFFFLLNFFSSTKWENKNKNEMVKHIALSTEIIGEALSLSLKVIVWNRSMKGAVAGFFCWHWTSNLRQNLKTQRSLKAGVFLNSESDQEIFWKTCYKEIDT